MHTKKLSEAQQIYKTRTINILKKLIDQLEKNNIQIEDTEYPIILHTVINLQKLYLDDENYYQPSRDKKKAVIV